MDWEDESGRENIGRVKNASYDELMAIARERVQNSTHLGPWADRIFNLGESKIDWQRQAQMEWLHFVACALDSEIIDCVLAYEDDEKKMEMVEVEFNPLTMSGWNDAFFVVRDMKGQIVTNGNLIPEATEGLRPGEDIEAVARRWVVLRHLNM